MLISVTQSVVLMLPRPPGKPGWLQMLMNVHHLQVVVNLTDMDHLEVPHDSC